MYFWHGIELLVNELLQNSHNFYELKAHEHEQENRKQRRPDKSAPITYDTVVWLIGGERLLCPTRDEIMDFGAQIVNGFVDSFLEISALTCDVSRHKYPG